MENNPAYDPADLIPLRVMGISYSQIQSGVFALILAQTDGPKRIPVMIGAAEAQAIALRLEGVTAPRPLTHDLFPGIWKAFGIRMTRVVIYRFEDGVFYSEITLTDGERTVTIDSRTSDAIAIAMRTGTPLFTTRAVLDETGFEMEEVTEPEVPAPDADQEPDLQAQKAPKLENYAIEELERTLAKLIEAEDYEQAAKVSRIIARKKGTSTESTESPEPTE